MKKNYFFVPCYFAILFPCWLLVIGTLKAEVLSANSKFVDTISCIAKSEPGTGDKSRVFVSKGTEVSNIDLLVNTEVIVVSDKSRTTDAFNSVPKKKKDFPGQLAVTEKKTVKYQSPVLKDEKIFDVSGSGSGSGVFLTYEDIYKCLFLRQNHQVKELIQIDHIGIGAKHISENDAGYIFLRPFLNKLCTEFPFTRPPPVLYL